MSSMCFNIKLPHIVLLVPLRVITHTAVCLVCVRWECVAGIQKFIFTRQSLYLCSFQPFSSHKLLRMEYGLLFANDYLGSSEFLLTYYFTFDLVIIFYKQLCYIQALRKEIKRKPWHLLVHLTVIWLCVLFGPQWP